MRKILLVMLALFSMFLTGCSEEKELDFTLISEDYRHDYIGEISLAIVEDYSRFREMFHTSLQELGKVNQKTFKDHVLIYFQYTSNGGYKKNEITLNRITKKDEILFFEILIPDSFDDDIESHTMYYLVEVEHDDVEDITGYQVICNTFSFSDKIGC